MGRLEAFDRKGIVVRRTNLCTNPAETLDALAGDPSNWKDFKNGSTMSLQPGRYVASCNVTERGSKNAMINFWDETHHLKLGVVWNGVIGVNVMQFDVQTASDKCNFSVCGYRATDFIVERADTHALASGGGFRASSPQAPRRTELEGGGGHQLRVSVPRRVPRPAWRGARNVPDGLFS